MSGIAHDASVQRDHSLIDCICDNADHTLIFWMKLASKDLRTITQTQSALTLPSETRVRLIWVSISKHCCEVDQCLYLWMSIPAVFVKCLFL